MITPSGKKESGEQTSAPPKNYIRVVSATSLFDGHDAAINIMRRVMQQAGMEIIHLGHNRSVAEIVETALQEDAQGVALTSYQGGHLEFLKYMVDEFKTKSATPVITFGGGGGVILPEEIEELHKYGVGKIFSPEDGRQMGLQGMINYIRPKLDFNTWSDYPIEQEIDSDKLTTSNTNLIAKIISILETDRPNLKEETGMDRDGLITRIGDLAARRETVPPVLGITGTGGAGKSSLVDEFIRRLTIQFPNKKVALLAVDPSKSKTGGALLGDRLRLNSIYGGNVFMRSVATRSSHTALTHGLKSTVDLFKATGFDLIIVETPGIGQASSEISDVADLSLYVMTPEFGAPTQLEKIDMLDYAHLVAVNKFDRGGGPDAVQSVIRQFKRNNHLFDVPDSDIPVFGTVCSRFNDLGMNRLYGAVIDYLEKKTPGRWHKDKSAVDFPAVEIPSIIPPRRVRYLAEIADTVRDYNDETKKQAGIADGIGALAKSAALLAGQSPESTAGINYGDLEKCKEKGSEAIAEKITELDETLDAGLKKQLAGWPKVQAVYAADEFVYKVRDKEIRQPLYRESLSHQKIPRVALPRTRSWGDTVEFLRQENIPGSFPFTAGLFPLKRDGEDPTRMFAGEGGPEQTNRRFHYLSKGQPAARLSTAFDSVTLYGENPDWRPDIYGKIGNSGVSICTLDDMKKLYSGFDLNAPSTSVSMTINGPAPMLLSYFMNTAVDQACEKYIRENGMTDEVKAKVQKAFEQSGAETPIYAGDLPDGHDGFGLMLLGTTGDKVLPADVYKKIKTETLQRVRGTVQADILKEDQAQNTCIFTTEFALKMMGDIQQYFVEHQVRNFYSVSVSGYHMAEAGCNPITQLAFTLANGFTFVEYYLSRGLDIDQFAPNLSFFFSNGLDPEYAVIGRVARRIWAKTLKHKYGASKRSQMLKYHIQTSGRSLHAQEIDFNDIRTTLQALYAIYDNCNSLHTNAYDEAVTTPTEESVRRAVAIQLIINRELGLAKNENPTQGAYIIRELTDLVEEAVLAEFERLSDRGGVLGAMETIYQRNKIQDESMEYEQKKISGEYPIIGVNTFLPDKPQLSEVREVIRSSEDSKNRQIKSLENFHRLHSEAAADARRRLIEATLSGGNTFQELIEAGKVCSLGQISDAFYTAGGRYRRNL